MNKDKKHETYKSVWNYAEMEEAYISYAKEIQHNKANTGIPSFDKWLGKIRPGQVLTFIGTTNIGKTALAQHILYSNSQVMKDKICLMFSCETSEYELYERTLQTENDKHYYEIEQSFRDLQASDITQYIKLNEKYKNIIYVVKRVGADEIENYMEEIEELTKKKIGLVVIDYLGLLENYRLRDEYQKTTDNMKYIRELCLKWKIPFVNFCQTARYDVKIAKEIGLHSGKGSGEIENSSHLVISLELLPDKANDKWHIDKEMLYEFQKIIQENKYEIIRAKIRKKKQGIIPHESYGQVYLLMNRKNLRFTEYEKGMMKEKGMF